MLPGRGARAWVAITIYDDDQWHVLGRLAGLQRHYYQLLRHDDFGEYPFGGAAFHFSDTPATYRIGSSRPGEYNDDLGSAFNWLPGRLLLEIRDQLERTDFGNLADLLNLEVDLLFFDTTSTYFVTGEADEPVARDKNGNAVTTDNPDGGEREPAGFRTWGRRRAIVMTCPRSSSGWP